MFIKELKKRRHYVKISKIIFFYHINIDNKSAGGIINFLRGFIHKLSENDNAVKISYCSLNYGQDYEGFDNIEKIVLKDIHNNANKKGIIPNNLTYIISLIKHFAFKKFDEDSLLFFNRADHVVPFIFKGGKKLLIVHGSSKFDKVYYEGKWVKRIYANISENLALKHMDALILVSLDGLEYYKQKYPKYSSKLHYIPTFFDNSKFYNNGKVNKDDCISYIYTGRFVKEKGMYELLEYARFLNNKNINFKMTLIGEGELEAIFKEQKNIVIINTLRQDQLCEYLNNCDIFLLFSHFEGTPLSLIESMATGTPAITSMNGELRNIVNNGETGFKYENVLGSFEEILKNSDQIKKSQEKFRNNCINFCRNYEITKVLNEYKKVFKEL